MNTNLNLYKVFYTVAKFGNLTRAAEQLMISQPAISKDIKTLEDQLGVNLIERTNNGVFLTEVGEAIYSKVENALEELTIVEDVISQHLNMEKGILKIGVSEVILDEYLMPYIQEFNEKFPNISLKIYTYNTDLIKKYQLGLVDIIFKNMPSDLTPDNCIIEEVRTLTNCFVASEKYSEYKNKKLSNKDLERLPLLLLNKGTVNRERLDNYCYNNNIKLNCKVECSSNSIIKMFTLKGLGVGMLDEEHIKEELENKKLFKLDLGIPLDRKYLTMYYNKRNNNLALKKFVEIIRKAKNY